MPIYKCNNCLKEFKQKSHYDKHNNNKKYPCKQFNDNMSDLIFSQISEKSNEKINFIIQEKKEIKCIYCNKIFKRLYCLNRHLDGRCIDKKQNDEINRLKDLMNMFLQNEQIKNETLKSINSWLVIN
jgi:DNA-directed RNA polymerase subunit RPC12/RpoP